MAVATKHSKLGRKKVLSRLPATVCDLVASLREPRQRVRGWLRSLEAGGLVHVSGEVTTARGRPAYVYAKGAAGPGANGRREKTSKAAAVVQPRLSVPASPYRTTWVGGCPLRSAPP